MRTAGSAILILDANTTSISYTVANGRVYDSNMIEIGSRKRARQAFWFEGSDASNPAATAGVTVPVGHVD